MTRPYPPDPPFHVQPKPIETVCLADSVRSNLNRALQKMGQYTDLTNQSNFQHIENCDAIKIDIIYNIQKGIN